MKAKKEYMLVIIGIILVVLVILVNWLRPYPTLPPMKDYTKELQSLNDSIAKVLKETKSYQQEWERLEKDKEELKGLIDKIIKENEKTDFELVNGSLDDNIKFLADYLSTESGDRDGHSSNNNRPSTEEHK